MYLVELLLSVAACVPAIWRPASEGEQFRRVGLPLVRHSHLLEMKTCLVPQLLLNTSVRLLCYLIPSFFHGSELLVVNGCRAPLLPRSLSRVSGLSVGHLCKDRTGRGERTHELSRNVHTEKRGLTHGSDTERPKGPL